MLYDKRQPSLADKIREQAEEEKGEKLLNKNKKRVRVRKLKVALFKTNKKDKKYDKRKK